MRFIKCCKGCTERYPTCHSKCERYKKEKEEYEKDKEEYKKQKREEIPTYNEYTFGYHKKRNPYFIKKD